MTPTPLTPPPDTTPPAAPPPLTSQEDPPDPDEIDGVEYLDSGRVRMRMGSHEFTLRAPLFGELKEYRTRTAEVDELGTDPELTVTVGAARVLNQKGIVAQTDALMDLAEWTVTKLTGRSDLPPRDERPTWLASYDLVRGLTVHWQRVPLLFGGSPRT